MGARIVYLTPHYNNHDFTCPPLIIVVVVVQFGVSASAADLWPGQRRERLYATYDGLVGDGPEERPTALALSEKLGITLPSSPEYGDAEGGGAGSPVLGGQKVRALCVLCVALRCWQPPPTPHVCVLAHAAAGVGVAGVAGQRHAGVWAVLGGPRRRRGGVEGRRL